MIPHTDIAIIGGGPVGAALALALEGSGLGSVVFEARRAGDQVGRDRPLALSWGSRLLLERLGVWDSLPEASAIRGIEVSQRGGFGRAAMKSEDAGLPALGYVVRYRALQAAQLKLHLFTQFFVQRRKRLIQQQHLGLHDERTRQSYALALATR